MRILPAGHRAAPGAAPLRRPHGAVAAPQAAVDGRSGRAVASPTSSSTRATTSGTRDGLRGLRVALDPLRGIPGVFVHGSNDHAAPSPRNPLRYFTGPSKREGRRASRWTPRRSTGTSADELGWLDLNNAVGSLDVAGSASTRSGSATRTAAGIRLDVLPDLTATSCSADVAPAALTIGVTHAPYRRVLDAFVDLGADMIFAGHTHGGQVRLPGLRRARRQLRHPAGSGARPQRLDARARHGAAQRQRGPRALDLRPGALRVPPRGIADHPPPRGLAGFGPRLGASGRLGGLPRGVAQLGSARRSGRRGRRFKSCHPDSREAPPTTAEPFAYPDETGEP